MGKVRSWKSAATVKCDATRPSAHAVYERRADAGPTAGSQGLGVYRRTGCAHLLGEAVSGARRASRGAGGAAGGGRADPAAEEGETQPAVRGPAVALSPPPPAAASQLAQERREEKEKRKEENKAKGLQYQVVRAATPPRPPILPRQGRLTPPRARAADLRQPEAQEDEPEAAEAHSEGRHHRPEASAGSREQETQKVTWSGLYIDCRGLCCRSIVWVLFVKSCSCYEKGSYLLRRH